MYQLRFHLLSGEAPDAAKFKIPGKICFLWNCQYAEARDEMMELRVYYEDTDAAGVVYHSNYLNFLERARTEFFRNNHLSVSKMAAAGFVFPVVKIEAAYRYPAVHDDLLLITTTPLKVGGSTFELRQQVLRQPDKKLLFEAVVTLACINTARRAQRIPIEVRSFLESRLSK